MSEYSNQVRLLVEGEVRRGNGRIKAWNTRLAAHALALQRGHMAAVYPAEVEKWRAQVHREVYSLHLKSAAAACEGRLPPAVLGQVTARLSEPLALVDELARVWLERPPTSEKPIMVVRGGTSAESVVWGALEVFDWIQRLWEEEKHPRDENGRFAHGAGLQGFSAYLQPTLKSPLRDFIQTLTLGQLVPVNHKTASEARERILELDKQYQSKEAQMNREINLLDYKLTAIEKEDERQKINPGLNSHRKGSEYRRLRNEVDDLYEKIASLQKVLRHEVWSQIAVNNPTHFALKDKDEEGFPLYKMDSINWGVRILEQIVDQSIVGDKTLWFRNTEEDLPYYESGVIHIGDIIAPSLVTHEIGHHIEAKSPEVLQRLLNYRAQRLADAKRSGKLRRDAKLEQLPGFPPNVKGYPGLFFDNYFSRRYARNEGTEMLSMGIQYYVDNPLKLIEEDAHLFDFIYNTLRGQSDQGGQ